MGVKLAMNTLDGYNSCLFVYGQTGTGKTYTMTGVNNDGLVQRTLRFLWRMLNERDNFKIKMSYLEVYNETVYDLFQERRSGIIC